MSPTKITYTRREAAEATGISEKTLDKAIKAGDLQTLPKPEINGRKVGTVLIAARELSRWIGLAP